jgi:hypothetical protein
MFCKFYPFFYCGGLKADKKCLLLVWRYIIIKEKKDSLPAGASFF